MAVFDLDQYISSLKTKYSISDDDLKGVEEVRKGFLRQDEFSRRSQNLDKVHAERMATEDQFHQQLLTAKQKLDLVDKLEAQYGPAEQWSNSLAAAIGDEFPGLANDNRGRAASSGQQFTLDQVQKLVQDAVSTAVGEVRNDINSVQNGAAIMIDFMSDVPERWKDRYGVKFPKEEFGKFFAEFAKKTGVNNPFAAFDAFERPHYEKHLQDTHKKEIDEAEKKGYQSAMSKYGHVETTPQQSEGMFFKTGKQTVPPKQGEGQPPNQPPAPPSDEPSYEERKARVGRAFQQATDAANSGKLPGVAPGS